MKDPENAFVDYVLTIVGPHNQQVVWDALMDEGGLVEHLGALVGREVHLSSQGANLEDQETYFSLRAKHVKAIKLLEYALHLRMYGERAPGGDETWREFDKQVELFLRELPGTIAGVRDQEVQTLVQMREIADFYKRAAITLNGEIEDTLAPVLGFEPFEPGEPGYSEDRINFVTGEHTAESMAFAAADLIEKQREIIVEHEDADIIFRRKLADLMGHFEADTIGRQEFIEKMSALLQGRS